ncbi:PREDICTED: uncharacterized protein LOC104822020 isoform X2 [Tarenaya hassleriana]|uniref:uncharacterized protein LOC104822020 isoform X2 n=1 Tax=Tarenaya hassleriana TaxID=28532 RepID=UPI00053C2B27|nr:PREDICTED: uncharacterized protein LOC104822020 isoform X2 [Tarenaya hassleriana]
MGFKRPFDDEESLGLPLKHSRQLDYSNKTTQFDEVVPLSSVLQKPAVAENEGNLCNSQSGESSDDETLGEELNSVGSGLGMGAACTWVTKSPGEEYTTQSSLPQRYFELDIPPRVFAPVGDVYTFLLDQPPRKQVPLGPDHQADTPEWEGDAMDEKPVDGLGMLARNQVVEHTDGQKLTGTCIIPMLPASSIPVHEDVKVGEGRKQCVCPDRGSFRCVRLHIKEAREETINMIGYEKFQDLGLSEMGEEVVRNWSEEDEQLFHEVVYSNPVSMGRNFWKHLAAAFPSRTKSEIVSYYFNVFVLRRRATQNRIQKLDVDSDDDEWHGGYGSSFGIRYFEEDDEEDSDIESPLRQETESIYRQEDEDEESDSDDEVDVGNGHGIMPSDDNKPVDKSSGDGLNVEDDSCTSFEDPQNIANSHPNNGNSLGDNQKQLDGGNDTVSRDYLFESCNAKVWDGRFSDVPKKSAELLPTRSIIEEIFGKSALDEKSNNSNTEKKVKGENIKGHNFAES